MFACKGIFATRIKEHSARERKGGRDSAKGLPARLSVRIITHPAPLVKFFFAFSENA